MGNINYMTSCTQGSDLDTGHLVFLMSGVEI